MPSRNRIDPESVRSSYERLQNGRAVARELGIHENTVYQVMRRFRGQCRQCSASVPHGQANCEKCRKHLRERAAKKRKERIRRGFCVECDRYRSPLSKMYCEEHRMRAAQRSMNYDAKRGTPQPGKQNQRQRERALKAKYGENAVAVWQESEGRCHVCAASNDQVSVQIHHVDENDKNNSKENLVCLCYTCHRTTHLMLRNPSLNNLLEWFFQTYPHKRGAAD